MPSDQITNIKRYTSQNQLKCNWVVCTGSNHLKQSAALEVLNKFATSPAV